MPHFQVWNKVFLKTNSLCPLWNIRKSGLKSWSRAITENEQRGFEWLLFTTLFVRYLSVVYFLVDQQNRWKHDERILFYELKLSVEKIFHQHTLDFISVNIRIKISLTEMNETRCIWYLYVLLFFRSQYLASLSRLGDTYYPPFVNCNGRFFLLQSPSPDLPSGGILLLHKNNI